MSDELWIGLVAFKALKKGLIEEGQEAFSNLLLYAESVEDFKMKAADFFALQNCEAYEFKMIMPYTSRWGNMDYKLMKMHVEGIANDKNPRFDGPNLFNSLSRIEWKTMDFMFHDLAFVGFSMDFEESAFSLIISDYNFVKRIYENYKVTFTKTVKIKFDEYYLTDMTNKYGPEIFDLEIKEIKDGLYEANITLLYGEHSNRYIIILWFEDIKIEKLSESETVKFRFGSWQTRVDIKD